MNTNAVNSNVTRTFTRIRNCRITLYSVGSRFTTGNGGGVTGNFRGEVTGNGVSRTTTSTVLTGVAANAGRVYASYSLVMRTTLRIVSIGGRAFGRLRRVIGPSYVFTAGASSLSVARVNTNLSEPLVNVRFFGPTPIVGLVRIVTNTGAPTSVITGVGRVTMTVNGAPIRIGRTPNFIMGEVLVPLVGRNVAICRVNVTDIRSVSATVGLNTGRPVNPLRLNSCINLSVILTVVRAVCSRANSPGCHPTALLGGVIHTNGLNHGANINFCSCHGWWLGSQQHTFFIRTTTIMSLGWFVTQRNCFHYVTTCGYTGPTTRL